MIFEKLLTPDFMFASYSEVTPEFLSSIGVRALICDIDNTLVTYDDARPTAALHRWFRDMESAGVKIAFVTNNHPERVGEFNRELGYVAFPDAKKPSGRFYALAAAELGVKRSDCAALGDQLLTDAAAAHRFGIPVIIVPPIKDKTSLFFRAKRLLEKPYIRKFRRRADGTLSDGKKNRKNNGASSPERKRAGKRR